MKWALMASLLLGCATTAPRPGWVDRDDEVDVAREAADERVVDTGGGSGTWLSPIRLQLVGGLGAVSCTGASAPCAATTVTSSSQFLAADGTAAAPGYAFTNDPDLGINRTGVNSMQLNATDTISFNFGGSVRVNMNGSGQLDIRSAIINGVDTKITVQENILFGSTTTTAELSGKINAATATASAPGISLKCSDTALDDDDGCVTIENSAGTDLFTIDALDGDTAQLGIVTSYGGIATAGRGLVPIRAYGEQQAVGTDATTVATITSAAAETIYEVGGNVQVTAYTSGNAALELVYTDCRGTARTLNLFGYTVAGASANNLAAVGVLQIATQSICADPSTSITLQTDTAGGTLTGDWYGFIKQIE